jgi:hypothetical protein
VSMTRPRSWARLGATVGLALGVSFGAPAWAEGQTQRPPPADGEHRLVRLGPQALVFEDNHGNVSMVDEPTPEPSRGQLLGAALGGMSGGLAGAMLYSGQDYVRISVYGSGKPLEDGPSSAGDATTEIAGGPPRPKR